MIYNTRERRGMGRRFHDLIWCSETSATRFTLALTATMFAVSSWNASECPYVGCVYLGLVAPWPVWGVAWGVYAVMKWWRLFDGKSRPRIALAVNIVGSFLFWSSAIALALARAPYFTLTASAISLAFASVWVLLRTDINSGFGYRGD